jgi:hypothetical protein
VIVNKYDLFLSDDDSNLSLAAFEASWILLLISGIFSTLASCAFVRAFHNDPPMKPIFSGTKHFGSDELLASWLFFGATFPFIPYCLIYVFASNFEDLIYLIAFAFAIVITIATLLFVRACYPSDKVIQCNAIAVLWLVYAIHGI